MAMVEVEVASRRYSVACRDGEEEHLRAIAEIVDRKAQEAAAALGSLSEGRQLLFASLLLADELKERENAPSEAPSSPAPPASPEAVPDFIVTQALERLADRMEMLADSLEGEGRSAYIDR